MTRNHRRPGVIRVICTDVYHRDTPEWAEHGHHRLPNLRLIGEGDQRRLTVPGMQIRATTAPYKTPDGTLVLFFRLATPGAPVKDYRRTDGSWVYRFACSCGRDPQRSESDLIEIIERHEAQLPGEPIDITRL